MITLNVKENVIVQPDNNTQMLRNVIIQPDDLISQILYLRLCSRENPVTRQIC
jgi:hypothetical protein